MKTLAFAALLALSAAPITAQEAPPRVVVIQEHNPAAAGIFSLLIPGAGQVYNGQVGKGVLFFGGAVLAVGMAVSEADHAAQELADCRSRVRNTGCDVNDLSNVFMIGYVGDVLLSIIDGVHTAQDLNEEARARVEGGRTADGRAALQLLIRTR